MKPLAIFSEQLPYPEGYTDRPTVKAVIVNERDEVLLFCGGLPGGGVESGETLEEALARECMEEIGAVVRIEKELGTVIAYRKALKLKYVYTGFHCRLVSLGKPTTTIDHEMGKGGVWEKRIDAINRIQSEINIIKNDKDAHTDFDRYYARIFMRETALIFLKEVEEKSTNNNTA